MILSTSCVSLAKFKHKAYMRQFIFMEGNLNCWRILYYWNWKSAWALYSQMNSKIILHLLFNYYIVDAAKLMYNLKSIKYPSPGSLFLYFFKYISWIFTDDRSIELQSSTKVVICLHKRSTIVFFFFFHMTFGYKEDHKSSLYSNKEAMTIATNMSCLKLYFPYLKEWEKLDSVCLFK